MPAFVPLSPSGPSSLQTSLARLPVVWAQPSHSDTQNVYELEVHPIPNPALSIIVINYEMLYKLIYIRNL